MEIKTTEEISQMFDDNPKWDDIKDNERWVHVDDVIKQLKNIEYRLHHDSSVICWEDLNDELIGELSQSSPQPEGTPMKRIPDGDLGKNGGNSQSSPDANLPQSDEKRDVASQKSGRDTSRPLKKGCDLIHYFVFTGYECLTKCGIMMDIDIDRTGVWSLVTCPDCLKFKPKEESK